MRPTKIGYRGFLLRVWSIADTPGTRASITDIETGETRVFVDVDDLCSWLRSLAPGTNRPQRAHGSGYEAQHS